MKKAKEIDLNYAQVEALVLAHRMWSLIMKTGCNKAEAIRILKLSFSMKNFCPFCDYVDSVSHVGEGCEKDCPIQKWGVEKKTGYKFPCEAFFDSPWEMHRNENPAAPAKMVQMIEDRLEEVLCLEDIDYEGIDPVILWAVQQGKSIKCLDRSTGNSEIRAIDCINTASVCEYLSNGYDMVDPEPITKAMLKKGEQDTEYIVKGRTEIVRILLEDGYEMNRDGDWDDMRRDVPMFLRDMFKYCGKAPKSHYEWDDKWLKPVE